MQKLLHDFEAAEFLKMRTSKLLRLAKQGKVPCVRLPDDEIRFIETDLVEWIEGYKASVRAKEVP